MLFADWPKQHFLNSTSEWVYLACSEYTSREVYSGLCLFSIRCFNVVQPETRFHFQKCKNFKILQKFFFESSKFYNFPKKKLYIKIFIKFQSFQKYHKISKYVHHISKFCWIYCWKVWKIPYYLIKQLFTFNFSLLMTIRTWSKID